MSPDLHHLSGAYAVDALDEDERVAFEEHLVGCADCRAEVAELTDAAHALAALTETAPPPGLRAASLAGIGQVRPLPPETSTEPERAGRVVPFARRASTWIAAAAAVVLLAVGGLVWGAGSGEDRSLSAVDRVRTAQDAATVTRTEGGLTATLAYSRDLDRSAISVTGLPPAPSGRTYQLWYLPAGAAPRPAGFLRSGADGRGSALLEGGLGGATGVGVTVEPAGGSPAPTTDPVLVLTLS